ncbi:type VI secretion system baseplate subunit TssE [Alcaligenes endophyticus]|uniref:Type VI secretion system baseplate subunit TssE n=1 Tax=Alcaligenes endophyticus TaxID=1929088 RepID=A0ABT8EL70_9BURK|nr:type VI secretion system baseplate subunit TssE [Alcaligenes endophyticus]MCX5590772.1 type VI secretion system baseplate subunit TssE [Alcaligenes endophyticus]MDN4121865.1 type VI secretion system baseplate subunit TssE [Alcaligenes endophyticus]
MAERLLARQPLQASLLDRLRDEQPEQRRDVNQGGHTIEQTKQHVLRDLAWLLNTVNLEAGVSLQRYPQVQRSSVNYGVAALAGKRLSDIEWHTLERAVQSAILRFEPRILPHSLQVRCLTEAGDLQQHNVIALLIKAQLWAQPYPRELLVRTEIDLETSQIVLQELHQAPEVDVVIDS